jgi:hypothetical protein
MAEEVGGEGDIFDHAAVEGVDAADHVVTTEDK